jgi:predicted  nucleic acid-binding Zn-ribbon protein
MTPQTRTSLRELQNLDQEIAAIRLETQGFDSLLEEVDGPVLRLEQEVQDLDRRLVEIRLEENRIELTIEERRVRAKKLQERMEAVRNVREEAAVHAELEMVRRALESEEQEALSLLDQIKRLEERHEEQEEAYREALAEVEPRRKELIRELQATESKLEALQSERDTFAAGIDPGERQVYDSIMAGARDVALAELTQDGACGNCYNMVPLQIQNQIRHTEEMLRCEGCGVILTPESPEGIARAQEEGERIERALKASTEERDLERAAVSDAMALEEADVREVLAEVLELEDVASDEISSEATAVEVVATDELPPDDLVEEGDSEEASAEELVLAEGDSDEADAEEPVVDEGGSDQVAAVDAVVEEGDSEEADPTEGAGADVEVDIVAEEETVAGEAGPQEPSADA